MIDERPLVSVAVITYNSSRYVLETLESIKAQTYHDIELIISDDCSTDNTVDICKKWVEKNKKRFADVQILEPLCNTGTAANCNRAIKASRGDWYKEIAGDDILMPDCIENNLNYIRTKTETVLLFSQMIAFRTNKDGSIEELPFDSGLGTKAVDFTALSAREQYLALLTDNPVVSTNAPTLFAKRDLLIEYPYNEFYKYSEDVPEWIKLTKTGIHIDCMNVVTVKYRRGDTITSPSHYFYSSLLWGSKRLHFWNELEGYLKEEGLYDSYNRKRKQLLKIELLECITKNKPTFFNKVLAIMIGKIINHVNYPKF